MPLEGNNELTQLAEAINDLSETRRQLRQREVALNQEKEQLIRTLSHDIRTPLTSILAYSDYLTAHDLPAEEQQAHLQLIRKKAEQIRDLTGILLDGTKRNPEYFADTRLLMEQLAAEFEEELEEIFHVETDLRGCAAVSGSFNVQELRRIFDNLSSNVRKYADPAQTVQLQITLQPGSLQIRQTNACRSQMPQTDGYQLGIRSNRRIVQLYGGQTELSTQAGLFSIQLTLLDF